MFKYLSYIKLVTNINFVHFKLESQIEQSIRNENLDITKTRAMILMQIKLKGAVNQKAIAELNNISPQAVHRHIKILEQKEYIIRKKSKEDIRAQNFSLTNSGRILIKRVQKVFITSVKEFFKNLNNSDRKILIELLVKIEDFNLHKIILNK